MTVPPSCALSGGKASSGQLDLQLTGDPDLNLLARRIYRPASLAGSVRPVSTFLGHGIRSPSVQRTG